MKNSKNTGLEIAIVGMSLRFPGANSPEEFWNNLAEGKESIKFYSDEELVEMNYEDSIIQDPNFVKTAGGAIDGKEDFDASFFGYTPDEAILMDPQTRIFHEQTWKAIEDSAIDIQQYKGRIGLYAGSSSSFYWEALTQTSGVAAQSGKFAASQLNNKDFLTTRVSHKLNLKGPSYPVFTACSTSLVAVHLAGRSLLLGECDMAVAGGITIDGETNYGYHHQEGMIFSKDGHTRAFDKDSTGTNSGNGVGVVVLKLLRNALKDGDPIYAVIKGSAINNDGNRKTAFSAPSVKGQSEVIRAAMNFAKVETSSIGMVECHGTGTAIGDPIEIEALHRAYAANAPAHCAIGSVKTNIGHLDAAAGVAGLIKAALCLKNKKMAPSLHFNEPNPKLNLDKTPFYVNTALREWDASEQPRRAGVSSFGIGGTNAHVVLEEAPEVQSTASERKSHLIALSAKSQKSLEAMTENLLDFLRNDSEKKIADVAYTLQQGRATFPYKTVFQLPNDHPSLEQLNVDHLAYKTLNNAKDNRKLVFLFPGGGAQYTNMAREVYQTEKVFRNHVDEGLDYLRESTGIEYKDYLFPTGDREKIDDTEIALPLLFLVEYALAKQLIFWGLSPDAMMGHSLGEYVAACVSGVMSFEDGLKLVLTRGKLMKDVEEGSMLSISSSLEQVDALLPEGLSTAAINSEESCVVSGETNRIKAFQKILAQNNIDSKQVHIAVASHSHMMDPILGPFSDVLKTINFQTPAIPYVANVTGDWVGDEEINDQYWVKHLRNTVLYAEGVKTITKTFEDPLFIEVGPGNILTNMMQRASSGRASVDAVNLLPHPTENQDDDWYLLDKIGELWLYGAQPDWVKFYEGEERRRITLPTYSFDPQRFWIDGSPFDFGKKVDKTAKKTAVSDWFYWQNWKKSPIRIQEEQDLSGSCLLIKDDATLGEALESELQQYTELCTVELGGSFNRVTENAYVINGGEDDFQKLFRDLEKRAITPDQVIFSIGQFEASDPDSSIAKAAIKKYFQLTYLLKCISRHFDHEVKLTVITQGIHEVLGNENGHYGLGMLLGPLKVANQENPLVTCGNIDICIDPGEAPQTSIATLIREIGSDQTDLIAAYRFNTRWIPDYEICQNPSVANQSPSFHENGTYLMTGGLGRVGYTLLDYLSKTYGCNLIITGRTPLPDRSEWEAYITEHQEGGVSDKIRKLLKLEQNGSEVCYRSVDTTDADRFSTFCQEMTDKYGHINGLLHAAALTNFADFQTITDLDDKVINKHFEAKVHGLRAINLVVEELGVDFCMLMSSISTVLGGLGYCAYASANLFMDHFAQWKNKHSSQRWISVCWDGWEYLEDVEQGVVYDDDFLRMNIQEGAAALEYAMKLDRQGVVIQSLNDLEARMDRWDIQDEAEQLEETQDEARYARPSMLTPYKAPATELEIALINIWQQFFKYEQVGINDNFFDLGGNSLKGVSVINLIQKKLGRKIEIKQFFSHPTIQQLAHYLEDGRTAQKGNYQAIEPAPELPHYPASSAQERLHFIQQIDPDSTAYNIFQVITMQGKPDVKRIEAAFRELIQRHEVLRTSFRLIDDELVQEITDQIDFDIQVQQVEPEQFKETSQQFCRPFDLSEAPLLRVGILQSNEEAYALMVDIHHIISDGVSQSILIDDFMQLYRGESLPELSLQYKDYAYWQRTNEQSYKDQEAFWHETFEQIPAPLELPADYPRPGSKSYKGDYLNFTIGSDQKEQLETLAKKHEVSSFVMFLSMYYIFLHKISGQQDITIGTPVAGRQHPDVEDIMGMFVNTLPIRGKLDGKETFGQFLKATQQIVYDCFENQEFQYENLVDQLGIKRDANHNPLFDVMFSFQNFQRTEFEIEDSAITGVHSSERSAKFDLILTVDERENDYGVDLEYATDLFSETTIQRFAICFLNVVEAVLKNPQVQLGEIEIISPDEKTRILEKFNPAPAEYPRDKNVMQVFRDVVRQHADRIALSGAEEQLTYEELDQRTDALASALISQHQLKKGERVAVLADRSIQTVLAELAILKAGGVYMPIDYEFPSKRIRQMLEVGESRLVLCTDRQHVLMKLPHHYEYVEISKAEASAQDDEFIQNNVDSTEVAYVMFTSGSTGIPKCVGVSHRNILRLVFNRENIQLNENTHLLQTGAPSFDATTFEIWGPLLNGGKLSVVPKETILNPTALKHTLAEGKVNTMFMTTGLFHVYAKADPEVFQPLAHLVIGGEAADLTCFRMVQDHCPGLELINGYGPTENTTFSTFQIADDFSGQSIPIGKPLSNSSCYIVDAYGKLQPIGVPGELLLGGDGVSAGYLNDAELTAEKFIQNPFNAEGKVYRSGDLAKWRTDGTIEFLGRMDTQLKINGFRIEVGDIVKSLLEHPEVKDAVVIPKVINEEKHLIGYYISSTGQEIEFQEYLEQLVPSYMIPACFVRIIDIPLNINGKLDHKALPEPNFNLEEQYEAPSTETEYRLLLIWSEILKRDAASIGVTQDFFQIGGNSLRAAVMLNKIQREFQIDMALSKILKFSEIRSLSKQIDKAEHTGFQPITKAPDAANYPLSSAQRRLLLLSEIDKSSVAYNLPHAIEINGELDLDHVSDCFNQLIRRHEVLRTLFRWQDDTPYQEIDDEAVLEIETFRCSTNEQDQCISSFIRPFNLSDELPIRVGVITTSDESHVLMVDIHHIVADGVSQGLLIQDFAALYKGENLDPVALHYKDYAVWSQLENQQSTWQRSLNFWKDQFEEEVTLLDLPTDYIRPTENSFKGKTLGFNLSKEQSDQLRQLSQNEQSTLYMTMLSLFQVLLYKLTDQTDIIVGTPVAGRQHPDVDNMIGMFVNTLVIREQLRRDMTFGELLAVGKEKVTACFDHQAFPYEDLLEELQIQRSINRNPLFDVMFAMENFESASLELPGLQVKSRSSNFQISKFDLTLTVVDRPELSLQYEFATDLFTEDSIKRFHQYMEIIVDEVLRNKEVKIRELEVLGPIEKEQLVFEFNGEITTGEESSVIEQLEAIALTSPEKMAISFAGKQLTYGELNEKANQLAHDLLEKGFAAKGTRIGIFTDHSEFGVVAILGVLKAGRTFVSISPDFPQHRIQQMIEDAEIALLLSDRHTEMVIGAEVLNWHDPQWQTDLSNQPVDSPEVTILPFDPAYIIFTSGTTGKPKGIIISWESLNDYSRTFTEYFKITEEDRVIQQSSLTFDTSIEEIFPTLISGAELIILPNGGRDIEGMANAIEQHEATLLSATPLVLGALNEYIGQLKSLRTIISGGDSLRKDQIRAFRNFNLYNTYGPSESTVCITYYAIKWNEETLPIGKPIRNRQVFIFSEDGNLCPVGVKGELMVGGKGLAQGYLNQESLTQEKFIDHPYEKGQKLYRTGDLASWTSEGNIEFWGRKDAQVKVRGYRVELSEVESALLKHQEIGDVVASVTQEGEANALVAYYQSANEIVNLRSFMAGQIPEYMVPSYFIHLDEIPLTTSGKVNRRLLPEPKAALNAEYISPANQTEKELVAIWSEVLKVEAESLSVTRNFFELGGQSLKATIMVNRIKSEFGKELPLKMVFSLPTIREMAFFLQSLSVEENTVEELDNEEEFNF